MKPEQRQAMREMDLSPEAIERIKLLRYDCIVEKHEGPEKWSWVLEEAPEFFEVEGRSVLLPLPGKNLHNVSVMRCIVGDGGNSLTLFLKDTTYVPDPKQEAFFAGFVAVCDRLPGEEFFVAIVYHEWFMSAPHRLS
jgi:hypothetical protein